MVVAVVLLRTGPSSTSTSTTSTAVPTGVASHGPSPNVTAVPGVREPTASAVRNAAPAQVWRSVLMGLDSTRSRAFEQADESVLKEVDAVGSTLYTSDVALMRQMVAGGAHATALHNEILDLQVRSEGTDHTVVRVTERLDSYDFLDTRGQVLAHAAAKAPERRDLTMVRTDSGWRLSENTVVTSG